LPFKSLWYILSFLPRGFLPPYMYSFSLTVPFSF
jgi:hypothetical protein